MYILKHVYSEAVLLILYQCLIIMSIFFIVFLVKGAEINTDQQFYLLQKGTLQSVESKDYFTRSEPICKDLVFVKMPDIFNFSLWKFDLKLMINKFPSILKIKD